MAALLPSSASGGHVPHPGMSAHRDRSLARLGLPMLQADLIRSAKGASGNVALDLTLAVSCSLEMEPCA